MRGAPILFAAAALASLVWPPPGARAEETADRYAMTPADGGFLRLDRETGSVSFCAAEKGAAVCRMGADERAALEGEIARLRRENAELKAARGAGAGLPSDQEFERALTLTERFLRRFMRLFRDGAPSEKI